MSSWLSFPCSLRGSRVGRADQTINALENVTRLLEAVGSHPTHILSATIWLADIATFDEMNAVWDSWVPHGHSPARATVEAKLAGVEYAVEIGIVAALA
ncbi:RidA family protein [Rhizobium sp. TH2]|uniref:RidA family protein n=1 Tax=Rhizobium sp. TH2 TaxID=2775403 RepID=UPI002157C6C9|nr:RidA family protein [Rhizobium sp. TH2]